MSSKFLLNPVKATCMKYTGKDYGIQGINDTCFGICAAFSGTNDVYEMDPACTKACTDLVEKRKHELFGVGSCDHQVPYRPVAWGQVPRFVPNLLRQGVDLENAKNMCLNMCQKVPMLSAECEEKCILDYNAVEVVEGYEPKDIIVAPTDDDYKQQPKKLQGKVVSPDIPKAKPIRGIVTKSSSSVMKSPKFIIPAVVIAVIVLSIVLYFILKK